MTDDTRKADEIRQLFHDFRRSTGKLKQQTPETMNGFSAMSAKIMQDGALSLKTKELIAVATVVETIEAIETEPVASPIA